MATGVHTNKVSLLESPTLREEIALQVEKGVPLTTALVAAGYELEAFREYTYAAEHGAWRKQPDRPIRADHLEIIREFVARIHQARARLEADLVERIREAGKRHNEKTGLLDWQPNAFLLQHHPMLRENWKDGTPKIVVHTDRNPRPNLADKTDAELIELAGGEWREILEPTPKAIEAPDANHP